MAKTLTKHDIEEFFSAMTPEQATEWAIKMGLIEPPDRIVYDLTKQCYVWFEECSSMEPLEYDGGQFSGVECYTYHHPELEGYTIHFDVLTDTIIRCYADPAKCIKELN